MSRPRKDGADYFPHYANSGKTIFTLESMYNNDGYAFWFKLLEILCDTEGHYYRIDNPPDWLFLVSKTRVNEETATSILKTLSDLNAICPKMFAHKIIWCGNLVDNLRPVYVKRKTVIPPKPEFLVQKLQENLVIDTENPQSRVEESKGEKTPLPPLPETREYPEWLNRKLWGDFRAWRKEKGRPLSIIEESTALEQLRSFRESGQDVDAVIRQSIVQNWNGLFPVKGCEVKKKEKAKTVVSASGVAYEF